MIRKIVKIDEEKCNGCGVCIPNCQEGALQIIDGKARLISDLFCDGLGACIGYCPEGAISIEEREAEPYDEIKVMEIIEPQGYNTILAHLKHLRDHGEHGYVSEALSYLKDKGYDTKRILLEIDDKKDNPFAGGGCPGMQSKTLEPKKQNVDCRSCGSAPQNVAPSQNSELQQWPIQMHLINPNASYFNRADLLMLADCAAVATPNLHSRFIKGKKIAMACPKLDSNKEVYVDKLVALIENANINTITVVMMEVPCCGGLLALVKAARAKTDKKIPIKSIIVSLQGEIISEDWVL